MARLPLTILIMMLTLSGCASLNSEFNCPAGTGVGCKSISEINEMVNKGKLTAKKQPATARVKHVVASSPQTYNIKVPKRTDERVLSIWIAPYEDKASNYHDAGTVHTVVKNSAWAATNQKRIN